MAQPRSRRGQLARSLSVSLYPNHKDILTARARELNCHPSIIMQILLELEERDGLLRPEVIARMMQFKQMAENN